DPMNGVEHKVLWTQVPAMIWPIFGRDTKSFVHLAIATTVWIVGTVVAVLWVRKRGFQIRCHSAGRVGPCPASFASHGGAPADARKAPETTSINARCVRSRTGRRRNCVPM